MLQAKQNYKKKKIINNKLVGWNGKINDITRTGFSKMISYIKTRLKGFYIPNYKILR